MRRLSPSNPNRPYLESGWRRWFWRRKKEEGLRLDEIIARLETRRHRDAFEAGVIAVKRGLSAYRYYQDDSLQRVFDAGYNSGGKVTIYLD